MVAVTAPAPRMPRSASIHSRFVSPMTAIRSPGRIPKAASPSDTSRARRASSPQETSCQRPSRLCCNAAFAACSFACRSRSATRLGAAGARVVSSASEIISSSFAPPHTAAGSLPLVELPPRVFLPPSLFRRIVPPGCSGRGELQLRPRLVGPVLLRVQIREVDVRPDVGRVLLERRRERLLRAVRRVLGPGQLVPEPPPGRLDGAVLEIGVDLLRAGEPLLELPLDSLSQRGEDADPERVVADPPGGEVPPLGALGVRRRRAIAVIPPGLAELALLLVLDLRVVREPEVHPGEPPEHLVVVRRELLRVGEPRAVRDERRRVIPSLVGPVGVGEQRGDIRRGGVERL